MSGLLRIEVSIPHTITFDAPTAELIRNAANLVNTSDVPSHWTDDEYVRALVELIADSSPAPDDIEDFDVKRDVIFAAIKAVLP